jgi:hypothetical protein
MAEKLIPVNVTKKTIMARYSKGSQRKVKKVMDEMKSGKLKSGRGGKKVTSRKQAIAIGLSEARKQGSKVPPVKKKAAKKKAAPKKRAAPKKKAAAKKARPKKSSK